MGRIVRASVDTARLSVEIRTQIAHGSLLLHDRDLSLLIVRIRAEFSGGEGVHVDIAVGAVFGTLAAADTPVFDDDLARFPPTDWFLPTARQIFRPIHWTPDGSKRWG